MPTVFESYSTVSSLPRSMPSRRASKPAGAGGKRALSSGPSATGGPKPGRPRAAGGRAALSAGAAAAAAAALGHELLRGEVAHVPRELDLVTGDRALVRDADLVALEVEDLDERDRVAVELALLQLDLAFLARDVRVGLARDFVPILLERVGVLLHADLRIELGLPHARDIGRPGIGRKRSGQGRPSTDTAS